MKPIRVYADTSVFGGVFDDIFAKPSRTFFDQIREGRFELISSMVVQDEIAFAPQKVRTFFDEMNPWMEINDIQDDGVDLQLAYIQKGIVGEGCLADALHVAMASVRGAHLLVSWNFKHIVHFQKVPLYNAVNVILGYPEIIICSPQEAIGYD